MTVYDIILGLREGLAILNPNTKAALKAKFKQQQTVELLAKQEEIRKEEDRIQQIKLEFERRQRIQMQDDRQWRDNIGF